MARIIGHRGAKHLAPENTLAAIRKALEHRVDDIEFDLRVTKDGVVVLHHDPTLQIPHGRRPAIATHTFEELRRMRPNLATFAEAVQAINRQVPMYVEVKPHEPIEPIVQQLKYFLQNGWETTDFYLASFNQRTLLKLHRELPELPTIVIEKFLSVQATRRAKHLKTKRIAMNQRFLWLGAVALLHRRGYELYAYNLDNPKKFARWTRHGLAGIVTNDPRPFTHSKKH